MYGKPSHTHSTNRHTIILAILTVLLVLLPASSVWAQEPPTTSVTLQQGADGYEGTTDTYLDLGNATTVWGAADRLRTKTTENADALLRFDVSSIPAGSTVQNATLRLYAIDQHRSSAHQTDPPAAQDSLEAIDHTALPSSAAHMGRGFRHLGVSGRRR